MQIKNQTSDSADLYFYGDIVSSWWGAWDDTDQYPESVKNFLNEVQGKNINIYVNSGGGSVFAGMAIYNMLKRHQGQKTVYVDGLAGSIASVIALAGDKIIIPSNAYMMIHKPWGSMAGNSTELRKMAETLDNIEIGILNVYEENLKEGVDIETIKQMLEEETWLCGAEASKYFNVEVTGENKAVACASDCFKNYAKVPEEFKARKASNKQNDDGADETKLNALKWSFR
ncbi:Clp protease [Peptoclostridium acidaminophilum DSM 3953]|uniref:ATP-dependent Clp protease proteolytic subunit n=1 Tax=Peptoclostridium acidaminophilum DSM 3953 TaxID=1286171 RepID=W8TEZ4_PEPAC|nr:head maturation protease, ClpP-related [Peptoclostridium acidaminophilum]AHM56403.1 Clp protease [Peptoclostridium acidaminophilum DSM 3953]